MDVKKLDTIPDGGGWKVHDRQMGSRTARKQGEIGYDYVHSLIDDHSRPASGHILPDEKGPILAAFQERGVTSFAAHEITRIERLMTDNAWVYRYSQRDVCATYGIRRKFTTPHCPRRNGKVERLHRTPATEWAYRQVFTGNNDRADALAPWLEYYNTQRRHTAPGGHPPISRLSPT
mgnify:CR=1 FL=1